MASKDLLSVEEFKALKRKSLLINRFEEGMSISQQMLEVAQKAKNDSLLQRGYDHIAVLFYKNRDYPLALKNALRADSLARLTLNDYALYSNHVIFGNIYLATKNYEQAKSYFIRSANYYREPKDYKHLQGFITSIYSVAKACLLLQQTDTVPVLLRDMEKAIAQVRPRDYRWKWGISTMCKACTVFI